jgi:protein Hikeshi
MNGMPGAFPPGTGMVPPAPQAAPATASFLGVLVAGAPLLTNAVPAGAPGRFTMTLPVPAAEVGSLALFLLPGIALPPDRGLLIFAAPAGSDA